MVESVTNKGYDPAQDEEPQACTWDLEASTLLQHVLGKLAGTISVHGQWALRWGVVMSAAWQVDAQDDSGERTRAE